MGNESHFWLSSLLLNLGFLGGWAYCLFVAERLQGFSKEGCRVCCSLSFIELNLDPPLTPWGCWKGSEFKTLGVQGLALSGLSFGFWILGFLGFQGFGFRGFRV